MVERILVKDMAEGSSPSPGANLPRRIRAWMWRPLKAKGKRLNKRRRTLSRDAKRMKKYFLRRMED